MNPLKASSCKRSDPGADADADSDDPDMKEATEPKAWLAQEEPCWAQMAAGAI